MVFTSGRGGIRCSLFFLFLFVLRISRPFVLQTPRSRPAPVFKALNTSGRTQNDQFPLVLGSLKKACVCGEEACFSAAKMAAVVVVLMLVWLWDEMHLEDEGMGTRQPGMEEGDVWSKPGLGSLLYRRQLRHCVIWSHTCPKSEQWVYGF